MPDSAVALAQQAIAAGADKTALGQALLAVVNPAVKKATDSKDRADWEAALKVAETVDAAVPTEATKFYVGLAAVPGRARRAAERAEARRGQGQGSQGFQGEGMRRGQGR